MNEDADPGMYYVSVRHILTDEIIATYEGNDRDTAFEMYELFAQALGDDHYIVIRYRPWSE